MTPEFRAGERVTFRIVPCIECGGDSDCFAHMEGEGHICEGCCKKNAAPVPEPTTV